jgi:hypothetical protein
MATELKIKITKDILKKSMYCGNMDTGKNCAIALAVRDIFPEACVGCSYIYPHHYGSDVCNPFKNQMPLPDEARNFIENFDNLRDSPEKRLEMEELEFSVKIPDSLISEIDISSITEILKDHKNRELVI